MPQYHGQSHVLKYVGAMTMSLNTRLTYYSFIIFSIFVLVTFTVGNSWSTCVAYRAAYVSTYCVKPILLLKYNANSP